MEYYPQSANELMFKLNLKSRVGFRKNYLQPALDAGLIEKTDRINLRVGIKSTLRSKEI